MNVLSGNSQNLPSKIYESSLRARSSKVQCFVNSSMEFPFGGILPLGSVSRTSNSRLVAVVRAVTDSAEPSNGEDDENEKRSEREKAKFGMSREDLERMVGADDARFNGLDLANLIRKKYGRSYDVQLIKKEFMGRNLLAMNVMWKYREQQSFPLTEEEYLLHLDDVANTLKCWGAVAHIRNSLETMKERPRIGKAVSIFIDMDETGGRSNEWIYK